MTLLHPSQGAVFYLCLRCWYKTMARSNSIRIGFIGCSLMLGVFAGCVRRIDPDEAIASVNEINIQRLANLYFTYQTKNAWNGPADEAELIGQEDLLQDRRRHRVGRDHGHDLAVAECLNAGAPGQA